MFRTLTLGKARNYTVKLKSSANTYRSLFWFLLSLTPASGTPTECYPSRKESGPTMQPGLAILCSLIDWNIRFLGCRIMLGSSNAHNGVSRGK